MRPIRVVLAGAASFAAMFVLGGLWNTVLMARFYEDHAPENVRSPQDASLVFILLGYLALAGLLTFGFAHLFRVRPSLWACVRFGALFGLIATLPAYLILHAIWKVSLTMMLVDSGWHMAQEAAGALILGLTLFPAPRGPVEEP